MSAGRAPTFSIRVVTEAAARTAIVEVSGRLDASSQAEAETFLRDVVDTGAHRVVLECSALDFVSSAGLRAIMAAIKWTRPQGGGVTLTGANPAIRQLIRIAGLEPLLEVVIDSPEREGELEA